MRTCPSTGLSSAGQRPRLQGLMEQARGCRVLLSQRLESRRKSSLFSNNTCVCLGRGSAAWWTTISFSKPQCHLSRSCWGDPLAQSKPSPKQRFLGIRFFPPSPHSPPFFVC